MTSFLILWETSLLGLHMGHGWMKGQVQMLDLFKRKRKTLKRIRFQLPGTKSAAKLNNLERHIKAFQNDECAIDAFRRHGGDMGGIFSGSLTEIEIF